MKTAYNSNNKDNIAISAFIAAGLIVLATGLFNSNPISAQEAVAVQKLKTIVVTASRAPDAVFDTMVVTASRKISQI